MAQHYNTQFNRNELKEREVLFFLIFSPVKTRQTSKSHYFYNRTNKNLPKFYLQPVHVFVLYCTYLLTPRCTVILEQLTGLQLVKKFPRHFTEPEGSLPHSQPSATCLYPWAAQSSPYTHISPPADPS